MLRRWMNLYPLDVIISLPPEGHYLYTQMKRTTVPKRRLVRTTIPTKARFYYCYIITNQITGKQYVGSRMKFKGSPCDDTMYMGSSKVLKSEYEIYGVENFTKVILVQERFIDKQTLNNRESYFIYKHNTLHPNGYNRYDPGKVLGFSHAGIPNSKETRQKISKALKGKYTGEKNSRYGKKHSAETIEKISKYQKEHSSRKGKAITEWHKQQVSRALKGKKKKPVLDITREKMSKSAKNRPSNRKGKPSPSIKGVPRSPEVRKKISDGNKMAKSKNK